MSKVADQNYYLVKGVVIGGKQTGKSTFLRQIKYGSPKENDNVEMAYDKNYDLIGGKLRVKVLLEDSPDELAVQSRSLYYQRAVVFVLFDLSRPATFSDLTGKVTVNVKYLMNEIDTQNRNPNLMKILVGTNADKVDSNFDKQEVEKYAFDNQMQYFEISCTKTA